MIIEKYSFRAMRRAHSLLACLAAVAFPLMPASGTAQGATPAVATSSKYVKGSLCTRPDQVVFSCPLAKSGKIVSMCASGSAVPHRFYYAFGRPGSVEMRYADNLPGLEGGFSHAYLGYSGGTAGYAYSFVREKTKYIVYYLSGKYQYAAGGVIVQKVGNVNALADMECSKGKIDAISNRSIFGETSKWKRDGDLEVHGLPLTK